MKKLNASFTAAAMLGLAFATSAVAQQTQENFPRERTQVESCDNVDWNQEMLKKHPHLVDACQEVVLVNGESWARFDAKFVRINSNGNVIFQVRDNRDRWREEVVLVPAVGQVAYIDDRETPFRRLRTTDRISLYVPEGQYGFATRPGVPKEQVAQVIVAKPLTSPAAISTDRTVAQLDTTPSVLPATATSLPWLALTGILALLGGMVLTLRRWS